MRLAVLAGLLVVAPAARTLDVPPLTGRVVDLADVLSASAEDALAARLQAHEDSTSNQVVVLTIPSLEGEILEPYATEVFRTWALGQAGRDNGVLLLVAVEDRELRIEVGYGLEGDLIDAASGAIIRSEIVPHFRNGDYEAGILSGVDAIVGTLAGTYAPQDPDAPIPVGSLWSWAVPGLFALLILPLFVVPQVVAGDFSTLITPRLVTSMVLMSGFVTIGAYTLTESVLWAMLAFGASCALYVLIGFGLNLLFETVPALARWREHRARRTDAIRKARADGRSAVVGDGRTYSVTKRSSGSGYSGGGGSSGGGGASGSW